MCARRLCPRSDEAAPLRLHTAMPRPHTRLGRRMALCASNPLNPPGTRRKGCREASSLCAVGAGWQANARVANAFSTRVRCVAVKRPGVRVRCGPTRQCGVAGARVLCRRFGSTR